MRRGENEIVGLKFCDFFEAYLRPILIGIDDGDGTGAAQCVGNESLFADGLERFRPDDEKYAARRDVDQAILQSIETLPQIVGQRFACCRGIQNVCKVLHGQNDLFDGAGVGGVGGDVERIERTHGVKHIAFFGHKDKVRMKRSNLLEIGINDTSDFGLFLGRGRIVAIVGVADETIFDSEGVDGFGETGSERNNARRIDGDANRAPIAIDNVVHFGRSWRDRRIGLCRGGA